LISSPGIQFSDLTFDDTGTLYAVSGSGGTTPNRLFTLDLISGAATEVSMLPMGGGKALAFNPDNGLLYHLYDCGELITIDPNNGYAQSSISSFTYTECMSTMTYQGNGIFRIIDQSNNAFDMDSTGALSFVSDNFSTLGAIEYYPLPAVDFIDNCRPTISQLAGPPSGSILSVNTSTTFGFTASDGISSDTCFWTISVVADTTPPIIKCPQDQLITTCEPQSYTLETVLI
jgi:hypothetical protein